MRAIPVRRVFGILLLLFSLLAIYWGTRPVRFQSREIPIYAAELQPTPTTSAPALTGNPAGRLILEWPDEIRIGDPASMRLIFVPNDEPYNGEGDLAKDGSSSQPGAVGPDDPLKRVLQARLDLVGIQHTPTGEIRQALRLDHPIIFLWNLRPQEPGAYDGKIWLHLKFGTAGGGEEAQRVLAAQSVVLRSVGLFGLTGSLARAIGGIGLVIGAMLSLDGIPFYFSRVRARLFGACRD